MEISLNVIIYLMIASVSLLSVTGEKEGPNEPESVSQREMKFYGDPVAFICKHVEGAENFSGFFKEDKKFHCKHLISTENSQGGRFSLTYNKEKRVIAVTISELTQGDTGTYQCEEKSNEGPKEFFKLFILEWDGIKSMEKKVQPEGKVQNDWPYSDSSQMNDDNILCKGENPFNCTDMEIHATKWDTYLVKVIFSGRLNYFSVIIKNLNTSNSGRYWCDSNRTWQLPKFFKIVLTVAERHIKSQLPTNAPSTKKRPDSDPPDTVAGIIGGVIAGLGLLVLLVVGFILCRHKLPRIEVCCAAGDSSEHRTNAGYDTEGNHGANHYEDLQWQSQQASSGCVLPSLYATINPPADQLFYASINFQNDSVSVSKGGNALPDTNENGSSATEYSSVSRTQGANHPPAAEQTLYSTVTKCGDP